MEESKRFADVFPTVSFPASMKEIVSRLMVERVVFHREKQSLSIYVSGCREEDGILLSSVETFLSRNLFYPKRVDAEILVSGEVSAYPFENAGNSRQRERNG